MLQHVFQGIEATVPSLEAYDCSVDLSIADISNNSWQRPSVVITKSKHPKPIRSGLAPTFIWGKYERLIAALLSYINIRGLSPSPLFHSRNSSLLTRDALVNVVRAALSGVGTDPSLYSSHSFRAGAATTAATVGIEDTRIKLLGQ